MSTKLKQGIWVQVRSEKEILATLDQSGCCAGMPFMPEMLPLCGRRFRVARIANKTCVNGASVYIGALDQCAVLQMKNRCDGSAHGNCQMACKFFWKNQWLKIVDGPNDAATDVSEFSEQAKLKLTKLATISENRFRCQATQLEQISTPTSVSQLGQYFQEYRSGVGTATIAKFFTNLIMRKLLGKTDSIRGHCAGRTPVSDLKLSVGESVKVKSFKEIELTLDQKGCNRGLWFDPAEMKPFCEKTMKVSRVINRLIDERTGKLKQLRVPCIVLSEVECSGVFRRFCSRGMLHFWREVWLTRV